MVGASTSPSDGEGDAEPERQPEPVDAELGGRPAVAGADLAGHRRGGGVGEEVEDREPRGQHRARDREGGERVGAEPPDDGGVGEQVQGFGGQRAQRRDREPDDLAIVRAPPGHAHASDATG